MINLSAPLHKIKPMVQGDTVTKPRNPRITTYNHHVAAIQIAALAIESQTQNGPADRAFSGLQWIGTHA
jgi:hypothetical protein